MEQNAKVNIQNRTIFCKDNLDILEGINSECIDLIYLDPPFNTQKIFTAPIGSTASGASFVDIFKEEDIKDDWLQTIKEDNEKLYNFLSGIKNIDGKKSYNYCYLVYIAIRLIECHRILKDTGSIYLHCDSTMNHYLKIVLDCIFGEKNFRNEVVWDRMAGVKGNAKNQFPKSKDCIFFYSKNLNSLSFKRLYKPLSKNYIEKFYRYKDKEGRVYRKAGGGRPANYRYYLDQSKGVPLTDLWCDINNVQGSSKEHTGYPTQKPLKLLERIIKASSNEKDLVLDPFCGCATTCIAAEKLDRKWVGIDISIKAYELVKERIKKEVNPEQPSFSDDKEVNFQMEAPLRTDDGKDYIPKKWVYVISNVNEKDYYKVGIAKDWRARLNSYQTADSDRAYKIEHKLLTTKFRELEKYIHHKFNARHEWVKADLKEIIKEIDNYEK